MHWKRLFQLRLGTLFLLVVLVSVLFAWWHDHRRLTNAQRQTVAVKNGIIVTQQELADACLDRYGDEMLMNLINRKMVDDSCARMGIVLTEADIDREVAAQSGKFGLSVDEWYKMLEEERDIQRERYRSDVVLPTLSLRELARRNPKEHAALLAALKRQ